MVAKAPDMSLERTGPFNFFQGVWRKFAGNTGLHGKCVVIQFSGKIWICFLKI